MLVAWKVVLAFLGFCCFVTTAQRCSCIDSNSCIARNGTVNRNSSEPSIHQCRGEEIICCGTFTEGASVNVSKNPHEPRVAPGGGCGRKRFSDEIDNIEETAFYGEAPWMVVILDQNLTLRCSGTLISPKVVLTAAHCLGGGKNTNLTVRAGEYLTSVKNKPIPSQTRSVYKLVSHSDFDEIKIINDIAIIVLEEPMELNAIVDVICTPEKGQEIIATECILTGFGYNSEKDSYQAELKKINYTYKSQEYCIEEMKASNASKLYHESSICGVAGEGNHPNPGDGGGPLVCPLKADPNKMVQMGIVSWSFKNEGKFPTAFTSVKHYLPWLREEIKEFS